MKGIIRGKSQVSGKIVVINRKRMDEALASKTFHPPENMTREETRQFIINAGKEDGDNSPGQE